jgi:hypothetical protein
MIKEKYLLLLDIDALVRSMLKMSYHKGKAKSKTKKAQGKVPKGYHRMPNGKLMKGATHKSGRKK